MIQSEIFQTLLKHLQDEWVALPDKPDETPDETLRVLWLYVSGNEFSLKQINECALPELTPENIDDLKVLVDQRVSHVPLAYLIGRQLFMGLELQVKPDAMIPRKETEILGRVAVDTIQKIVQEKEDAFVVDVCTGSGNLALAMAYYEPGCRVLGMDLSDGAVTLARQNAAKLKLDQRAQFSQGDLFDPLKSMNLGPVDMIVCNPPYLSSSRVEREPEEIKGFEPRMAFDAGPFGVSILTRVVREAYQYLKPGSPLCVEVGLGQGKAMTQLLERTGKYMEVIPFCDSEGEIRVLQARTIPSLPS
jgi:release factor glutamine methyltransferase